MSHFSKFAPFPYCAKKGLILAPLIFVRFVCAKIKGIKLHRKGAALDNCWGFVDGTVRPICRPGRMQRVLYNGHKKVHALKFQSIAAPNVLIANLYGPVKGRRHDSALLAQSQIYPLLSQYCVDTNGRPLCIYGDPAYPLRPQLQAPFRNAVLTQNQKNYNMSMSQVRSSVEWLFADITNWFAFIDLVLVALGKCILCVHS